MKEFSKKELRRAAAYLRLLTRFKKIELGSWDGLSDSVNCYTEEEDLEKKYRQMFCYVSEERPDLKERESKEGLSPSQEDDGSIELFAGGQGD